MAERPLRRRDAFFGLHFDLHANESDEALGAETTEQNIRELMQRVRPDWVQWDCKGHPGYASYPTEVGWSAPGIEGDALAVLREVTREMGVALLVHYSGVMDQKAIEEHPEWAARTADREPDERATSTFGDYVDELMIPQLREVVEKYDIDGLWVDGDCWAAVLDYCPRAVEQWREETGLEPPAGPDDEGWHQWKDFHREQFLRYLRHWVDALHEVKPDLDITSNWMYSTYAPVEPEVDLDYLSGDFSPTGSCDRARLEARYFASTGKPWDLMAWGFNRHSAGRLHKPPVQLMQEAGVVLSQGGAFQYYYQPTRAGRVPSQFIDTAAEVAGFCRARQLITQGSTSVPQVALLLPTDDMMRRSDRVFQTGGVREHVEGALHALLELHYSVDVLAEWGLMARLEEFPLVVVPDAQTLAAQVRDALVQYVRSGGSLLLIGPHVAGMFATELSVRLDGAPKEETAYLTSPMGMGASQGLWQAVTHVEADGVALRFPTFEPRHGVPAATVAELGDGMIGAAWGQVGAEYRRSHHPALRHLIGELAERLFPTPDVSIVGPPSVEMALRRTADGRLALHMLNLSNAQRADSHLAVEHVPEVGPIGVELAVEDEPSAVTWEPDGEALQWSWADGVLSAAVPGVHIHGAVVVS
ncbi:MAG: alpha-amylase family protein [Armatimonadota bacterium]|nr:alpha-amylase family protein [Armatimonadota bacterium]